MAQRRRTPQLKFMAPRVFSGRKDEDVIEWLDHYESVSRFNRWENADLHANFGMYLEGTARLWFRNTAVPVHWESQVGANREEIRGLRAVFLEEFQQESYGRWKEAKLRNRKQQPGESGVDFYYSVIDLCRLVDPAMSEERKLDYLFKGMKPWLLEKLWVTRPQSCAELLKEIKLHAAAAEMANQVEWAVAILGKERVEKKSGCSEPEKENHSFSGVQELEKQLELLKITIRELEQEISSSKEEDTSDELSDSEMDSGQGRIGLIRITSSRELGNLITKEVSFKGYGVTAVIDTGAEISVVSPSLVAQWDLAQIPGLDGQLLTMTGQRILAEGIVTLSFKNGDKTFDARALVLEMDGLGLLLGNNVLKEFQQLVINYEDENPTLLLGEPSIELLSCRAAVENKASGLRQQTEDDAVKMVTFPKKPEWEMEHFFFTGKGGDQKIVHQPEAVAVVREMAGRGRSLTRDGGWGDNGSSLHQGLLYY